MVHLRADAAHALQSGDHTHHLKNLVGRDAHAEREHVATRESRRDAYRSRLFGLFSEEVVRHWCANDRSPYRNLGRPTQWSGTAYATLDVTLQSRTSHACYVAEQKAEMARSGYPFLRLADASQLAHHTGKRTFDWLLDFAKDARSHSVRVNGRPLEAGGAIPIWGRDNGGRPRSCDRSLRLR